MSVKRKLGYVNDSDVEVVYFKIWKAVFVPQTCKMKWP